MPEAIAAGIWVEVHRTEYLPADRAPGLPADTAQLPYESWIRGFLTAAAAPGEAAVIETLAGRRVTGRLTGPAPAHSHTFGSPHPAMLSVGPHLRRTLAQSPAPLPQSGKGGDHS